MLNLSRPLSAKRRLSILAYTTNPKPDGGNAPYVALPADYFPTPNWQQRSEQAAHWFPILHELLNADSVEVNA